MALGNLVLIVRVETIPKVSDLLALSDVLLINEPFGNRQEFLVVRDDF